MEIKDTNKIKVGEILAEIMDGKTSLEDGKKRIKGILHIEHKDLEMAKDAPELELVIKREMGWG